MDAKTTIGTRFSVAVCAVGILSFGATAAFAGEWNPNKGDLPAKENGNSPCLFNGLDQPDDGDNPEDHAGSAPDDFLWGTLAPAGANSGKVSVQTGGQLIALGFVPPGTQGTDCNPTTPSSEP